MDWPPILDPTVLERMTMPPAAFEALLTRFLDGFIEEHFSESFAQLGAGYPFARPAGSFILDGTDIGPLTPDLHATLDRLAAGELATPSRRYPLLAIGANGAPDTLIRKLSKLTDPEDRRVMVIAGQLHDFDVGPTPRLAPYGAFPATLIPSAGTIVDCSVLWTTAAQFTALTDSEIGYHVGRLDPMLFEGATGAHPHRVTSAYVYVSRWGNLTVDGDVVTLAALSARNRHTHAMTQEQLLTRAARITFGRMHSAADLIERLVRDPRETLIEVGRAMDPHSAPFEHPSWTAYPGSADNR